MTTDNEAIQSQMESNRKNQDAMTIINEISYKVDKLVALTSTTGDSSGIPDGSMQVEAGNIMVSLSTMIGRVDNIFPLGKSTPTT